MWKYLKDSPYLFALIYITTPSVIANASTSNTTASYCRDKGGLDCDNIDDVRHKVWFDDTGQTVEGYRNFLESSCCILGGGHRIGVDDRRALHIVQSLPSVESDLYLTGSAGHQALFWVLVDDEYISSDVDIDPWLVQRFVLAMTFFQLDGVRRWYGYGYNNYIAQEVDGSVKIDDDRAHLLSFNGTNWLGEHHECEWAFITCNRNNFVTQINMPSNVMGAEFSREVEEYPMSAQKNVYIVPEIYYLKNLVKIDLRHNYISGTVPSEIARLKLLRELNLYGNNISGSLPVELYSMQGLERLVIGRNQLTGVIVPEITGLARLRELHLGYNSITGYLPTSLGALVSLEFVNIRGNSMEGSLSESICSNNNSKFQVDGDIECLAACCIYASAAAPNTSTCNSFGWAHSIWYANSSNISFEEDGLISCDWIELHDDSFCNTHGGIIDKNSNRFARKECCHCGSCQDTAPLEESCSWFIDVSSYGCSPYQLYYPEESSDCCWCKGGGINWNENRPSISPSISHSPIFSLSCRDFEHWSSPGGFKCSWWELYDEPGCPNYGMEYPSEDTNIYPNQACCFCGGGIDDARPSQLPTTSQEPSALLFGSLQPSVSLFPTTTSNCIDDQNWKDLSGRDCTWYTKNEDPFCSDNWFRSDGNGTLAVDACCRCKASVSPTPSFEGNNSECQNILNWKGLSESYPDGYVDCNFLERNDDMGCTEHGDAFSDDFIFARDACCHCGGGITPNIAISDSIKKTEECVDFQVSRPWPAKDCAWFASGDSKSICDQFGNEPLFLVKDEAKSAKDVCCACGGGFKVGECKDFPGWIDSHSHYPYTCDQYESAEACDDGEAYFNFGLNGRTACCICGGGYYSSEVTVEIESMDLIENSYGCFSDFGWNSGSLSCANFTDINNETDIEKCLTYGHLTNAYGGTNASHACCNCRFGYESQGGGYRGKLINKIIRLSLFWNDDIDYLFSANIEDPFNSTGAIIEVMRNFSLASGFGTVFKGNSNESLNEYGRYSSQICLNDLLLNKADICIAPFWNTSSFSFQATKPIMRVHFYLVTTKRRGGFLFENLIYLLISFTPSAWFLIIFTILVFGMAVDYVTGNGYSFECIRKITCMGRMGNIWYNAFTLFLGKRPVTPSAKGAEKIAIVGFAMFTLFVVSSFTGSITASIVTHPPIASFKSVEEAIQGSANICVPDGLDYDFVKAYPGADGLIKKSWFNTTKMLEDLQSRTLCEVAIVSNEAFQSSVRKDETLCDDLLVMYDEVVISFDIVTFPIGPLLGEIGDDIISLINEFIDSRGFAVELDNHKFEIEMDATECRDNISEYLDGSSTVSTAQIFFPALLAIISSLLSICYYRSRNQQKALSTVEDNQNTFGIGTPHAQNIPTDTALVDGFLTHQEIYHNQIDTKSIK